MESMKEPDAHVVRVSVQSVVLHLDCFQEDTFDYLSVDEAHHAAADTYQKILAFFHPAFTLGLTATPERNRLIVDTWLRYTQNKRTVVFCASVWHTEEIAELFRQAGVSAAAVSGGMKQSERKEFQNRFIRRERPAALLDWPMDATDYELVDLFDWQEEARGMISQMEFVRRVNVRAETIEHYVQEGKLIPEPAVPMSEHRTFKYFKEETVQSYARQYGWTLINDRNRKDLFLKMVRRMDISYSYKPVLVQAILRHADEKGRVKLSDVSDYFRAYYEHRRVARLVVEKPDSIFAMGGYTDREAQRNILANPFKRFEDMQILRHTRTLGSIQVDEAVWKRLTEEEKAEIGRICQEKLEAYYQRFAEKP